ncbi:outer membrane beta-barrel family protein [Spirosoma sp.]|uniref:outer membrane beta-barrel family protein n=1 Tax=Spirosoma sp. TaxID=1899569 RepID=UPI00261BC33C|nr:outer membrane beta-barrel family protein [Spirosoma sp.]MCX6213783.1 outer membrane beta-barrel family protein [Spirosoma sp.]
MMRAVGQSTPALPVSLTIAGQLTSETKQPVIQATVSLLQVDSSLILTAQSDSSGYFRINVVHNGAYLVRITHVGLQSIFQPVVSSDSTSSAPLAFTMQTKALNLAEVSVKQKRPFIELLGDRTLLNVEDNPLYSGGTTLDLLSLAPRLSIDVINRKVAIDDKPGVVLYQDNRQVYIPSERIVAYLQSLPANSISRIEILTNPSARYDANSGGVILLFTKNFYQQGTSLDLDLTGGFGRYIKANASVGVSVQKTKLSGKFLYNPSYRPTYFSWNTYQTVPAGQYAESGYSSGNQLNKEDISAHLFRTNWDLKLTKQQTIGAVLMLNQISDTQNPSSSLEYQLASPSARLTKINSISQLRSRQLNLSANVNYQFTFSKPQTFLTIDIDAAQYTDNSRSRADYTLLPDQPRPSESLVIDYPNTIRFKTAKADFTTAIFQKGTLETGVKYSAITLQNQPDLLKATPGFDSLKRSLIRAFHYDEFTSAAYSSVSYQWSGISVRAGLRLEHTHYEAQVNNRLEVIRDYTNLFPTVSIQYTNKQSFKYTLNFNRRIVRPAFDVLNPSYIFYNPLTLYTGNPLLLPQLSSSFQLGLITPKRLSLSLSYNHSRNRITEILFRNDTTSAAILNYYINFDWEKRMSLVLSIPVKIRPFWQVQATMTGLMSRFYSTFERVPITTSQPTVVVKLLNTFSMGKLSATLAFTGRNTALIGYLKYKPIWYLDAGLQYSINNNSSLKMSATDIFHTLLLQNYGNYLNTSVAFYHKSETQQLLVSYALRFGHTKAKPVNEREFGSESEQQRLGGKR